MNRQFAEGGNVVIPVWHGVTRDEVAAYSAFAVDIRAIDSNIGIDEVVATLHRRLLSD